MLKRILLLDTETTGLDHEKDVVIEVACTLFDVPSACPVGSFATLVRADENPAQAINGIPVEALRGAPEREWMHEEVRTLAVASDAIVAHRADFDRGFLPPFATASKPWICSKFDLLWPRHDKPGGHLVQIALAHGLGVASAHRAMADVDTLSRLFTRVAEMGHDLQAMLARGLRPKAKFAALVSYDDRDKAKEAGFAWDGPSKTWWRVMAIEDAAQLPFRTRQLGA